MILDELVLHNVGVFGGRHAFALTPPDRSKPVVLVGALNGAGKTTFMDALHLALFGPLARTAARRNSSYQAYLRRLIHQGAPPSEGAAVELAFHVYQEGTQRNYRIVRSWRESRSSVREQLDVIVDGARDSSLSDRWGERVEAFIPRGVAELFFFDGEKIETLAELDNARDTLRAAIGSLLGLDLVDRLSTDLTVLERNHRANQAPPAVQKLLDGAKRRVDEARSTETQAKQQAAAARTQADRAEHKLQTVEDQYRLEGGQLLEQRNELETRRQHLAKTLDETNNQLIDIASGEAPLLLVRDQLAKVSEHATHEIAAQRHQLVADVLDERDAQIVATLRDRRVKKQTVDDLEQFLANEREQRATASHVEQITELDADAAAELRRLLEHELDNTANHIARTIDERAARINELEDVTRTLAAVPNERALEDLRDARDAAITELTDARMNAERAEAAVADAERSTAEAQRRVHNLLEKAAEEIAEYDDTNRIIDHAERVRGTLSALRTEATRRNLSRIQGLVTESLGRLLRKDRLITDLQIDPETFDVSLHGRTGDTILPQQLSAGERQLLAVSLLWGLGQASGKPLPVVIDTPLGRLDSAHRRHLISRYFPQASHQVILLSTDQEIDRNAWEALHQYVGHAYCLEYDADSGSTTAEAGYFWPAPTTRN
ncbi:DNA sulfur modification protein DndD [Haloechinothrix halophila]|uniref:DNA sulfur modification protein DndD n=1 Tax=Haloechinothrix halophila TaxID=1069073 RepID=UPI00054F819C|nr:DNA sulfur modification protein DndD [Haloechinothrix halophila]